MCDNSDEHSLPFILTGAYFKIISQTDKNIDAECQLCPKTNGIGKIYKGSIKATTNFRDHLKRKHKESIPQFQKDEDDYAKVKKVRKSGFKSNVDVITTYMRRDDVKSMTKTDKLILNFVVKGMHPLSIVDEPEFRNLITGLRPDVHVMSNKTLTKKVHDRFAELQNSLRKRLEKAKYICLTVDMWTCKGMSRSFMGMTAHWINKENLQRDSAALACRRFKGKHTYDRIYKAIEILLTEYEINGAVSKIVTDNASNFGKAFRIFGVMIEENEAESGEETDDDVEIEFDNVADKLESTNMNLESANKKLPPHHKCSSHTLNLICTSDAKSFNSRLQRSSFAKCFSIWNKVSRSTQTAEKVKGQLGKSFATPVCTRWNSFYDSVQDLLDNREHLENVCSFSATGMFTENELEFLTNYCSCVKPIADALDKLQGENHTYFGYLIPTLLATESKLKLLFENPPSLVGSLPRILLEGLQKRFQEFLGLTDEVKDSIIASVSHPKFKLRWVPPDHYDRVKELFVTACSKEFPNPEEDPVSCPATADEDDDFFMFKSGNLLKVQEETNEAAVNAQCLKYLADAGHDLTILENYRFVKNVFIKYNSPLPSSAPVERLFNYANMILRRQRRNLKDDNFEMLTLLKVNNAM